MWNLETCTFSHTQVFFERHSDNNSNIMTLRWDKSGRIERDELNGQRAVEIPDDTLYPSVCEGLTICRFTPGDRHFIKGPCLSLFDPTMSSQMPIADLMIQEALICEQLKRNPHPNIAEYWGCVVSEGKVRGLCFTRYHETLFDRLDPNLEPAKRRPLSRERCLKEIRSGLSHLHELGLAHNDVVAHNIMLGENDTIIITDFDSCFPEDHPLGIKPGVAAECNPEVTLSSRENDELGLGRIGEDWEDGVLRCRPTTMA